MGDTEQGRISEIAVHYDWYDIFTIRLWASPAVHPEPRTLRLMLDEWCKDRWGTQPHIRTILNQQERADHIALQALTVKLMTDLDCEAVEVMDVQAGTGCVEHQRW